MSKGTKAKIIKDKLEICYVGSKELIDNIENTKHWDRDGYYLECDETENKDKRETILSIWLQDWNEEKGLFYFKFGTMKFGNSFECESDTIRYCWLRVDNEVFYMKNQPLNSLYYIQDDLGLEFNNITSVDIAIDSNICWFRRIKQAVRNNQYIPIILNKAYPIIGNKLKGYRYDLGENRKRYIEDTIYITNKEKNMEFTTYNKSDEIEESNKSYIKKWFEGDCKIFRAEIRLKNKILNDFCNKKNITQLDLYMRLYDENLWFDIYYFFSNRLIRFIDNSRKPISFLQL